MGASASSSSSSFPPCKKKNGGTSASLSLRATLAIADAASWLCVFVVIVLILLASNRDNRSNINSSLAAAAAARGNDHLSLQVKGNHLLDRPCDEIYVVGEGETLHTISDKCGDPFIVERNPHIHDPDDVFPGLVIRIMPCPPGSAHRKLLMKNRQS